jgi:uncharacterized protein YjbJ (UPF0337 family)
MRRPVGWWTADWRRNRLLPGTIPMVTKEELKGRWSELKGKLQEHWGQLTDNDLQQFNGNVNQLVGVIQRKTGEQRENIEDFLEQLVGSGSSALDKASSSVQKLAGKAKESVEHYTTAASESMRENYGRVSERVQSGYETAASCVRRSPLESVAVTFGAGLISGVIVSMLMRRR